jgi:hypothetical protein
VADSASLDSCKWLKAVGCRTPRRGNTLDIYDKSAKRAEKSPKSRKENAHKFTRRLGTDFPYLSELIPQLNINMEIPHTEKVL